MKTLHPERCGLIAAALFSAAAWAGPSQSQIDPPGGFATACASEISSGGTYTPGLDLTSVFSSFPGRYACQSQVFSGAAGQASAAASWSAPEVQNASSVSAGMGEIHLRAQNSAPVTLLFPVAVSGGGWSEQMVVDLAGHTGESAIWQFRMDVDGFLSAAASGLTTMAMNAYLNEKELPNNVAGFDKGGSDAFTTDRQRVAWSASGNRNRTVDDHVIFAVPVTLGQSFVWGVYATARGMPAAYSPTGSHTPTQALADFSHTLHYGGSAGLLLGGQQVGGYTLSSASGIDWMAAAPVPEPGTWALWAAGALLMLWRVRRADA